MEKLNNNSIATWDPDFSKLRPCNCNKKFNLPMMMLDDSSAEWLVECDFCGNKTKRYNSEEIAEFKWNEFQFKRALIKECPALEVVKEGAEYRQPLGVPWG